MIELYCSVILRITELLFDDKGMYIQGQWKDFGEFFVLQHPSHKENLEFSCIFRTYRRRAIIWYMISLYLESIKFCIFTWIKLARNAFEDMAICKVT